MTLWHKGSAPNKLIERFTIGNDTQLDKALIVYDCLGSIAHAYMLYTISILTHEEFLSLKQELLGIMILAEQNQFTLNQAEEDVHTAVEKHLTRVLGDVGKKIHTARSRNDQVLVDTRLYTKDHLITTLEKCLALCSVLIDAAELNKAVPVPGRTHFQKAMPSSFGLLFGAYAESLLDDAQLIVDVYNILDQCPLGSAASYGASVPLNRELVAQLLGFSKIQNNVLYANNSRGKLESMALSSMAQIMMTLNKLATDLIIFNAPEFGYINLPAELCSGSSLMPQKNNPDVLELVRAKSASVLSALLQTFTLIHSLPSGYNRDFQETKEPLMRTLATTQDSLEICALVISQLTINKEQCLNGFTPELFATDAVLKLTIQGMPFREAYQQIAKNPHAFSEDPVTNIMQKKHQGAPGNLGLDKAQKQLVLYQNWLKDTQKKQADVLHNLKELL